MITALEFPLLQPAGILAWEEVLLEAAEAGECGETLSFWESATHFIVLGYGNKVATEVNQAACKRLNIPILRRISGGGTVLQGPGVLNYSLVLRAELGSPLAGISSTNQFIMQRVAQALTKLLNAERGTESEERVVEVQGHTDLAIGGKKFSGNAQRRKRTHLLFHGSILLHADFKLIEQVLPFPSLQPEYRQGRGHSDFLTQFPGRAEEVKTQLKNVWSATFKDFDRVIGNRLPAARHRTLVEKYLSDSWNLRV